MGGLASKITKNNNNYQSSYQKIGWNVNVRQAFWLAHKILGAAKYLNETNIGVEEVMNIQEYFIRLVYDKFRGELPKVE